MVCFQRLLSTKEFHLHTFDMAYESCGCAHCGGVFPVFLVAFPWLCQLGPRTHRSLGTWSRRSGEVDGCDLSGGVDNPKTAALSRGLQRSPEVSRGLPTQSHTSHQLSHIQNIHLSDHNLNIVLGKSHRTA